MTSGECAVLIYTTFGTLDEAREAGARLIDAKVAACVNILPGMVSIYEWKGERNEESEVSAFIKTRSGLLGEVMRLLKDVHPYETPAMIAFEPARVDADFEAWIFEQTGA